MYLSLINPSSVLCRHLQRNSRRGAAMRAFCIPAISYLPRLYHEIWDLFAWLIPCHPISPPFLLFAFLLYVPCALQNSLLRSFPLFSIA